MAALVWGVKQSFRNYVESAGGAIALTGGVERAADGLFVFPATAESALSRGDDGRPQGVGRFAGTVRFQAHGGMLSVELADPWVESTDAGLVLSVAASPATRVVFAKLDAAAMTAEVDGAVSLPAAITLDGMYILGDHYPPGTILDPVRLAGI